ncbi:putative mitochondrial protein [Tanacetum coccineum]|uniref:Mitochondrial protein n=1 Tax=Tanacetum coccineum TaxID=301880 RepID=A0ABQ5F3T3_9ASTR
MIDGEHQRWLSKLLGYDIEIQYKPGKENSVADSLSRRREPIACHVITFTTVQNWDDLMIDLSRDVELTLLKKRILNNEQGLDGYTVENDRLLYKGHLVLPRTSKWIVPQFRMKKDVARMVSECEIWQQHKYSTMLPSGLLQPLELLEKVWDDITMDFIDKLPRLEGYIVIFVVVDRLRKYAHFIPLRHPYTAVTVAAAFLREERDGIIQELKVHLAKAQQLMKNKEDSVRRDVQFEVGDRVYLKILPYRQRTVARQKNEKLAPKYFGPYEVLEKIGYVAYKLKLPESAAIHPIFHVSQLKKAIGEQEVALVLPEGLTEDMEVLLQPEEVLGVLNSAGNHKEGGTDTTPGRWGKYLADQGCIKPLCDLLVSTDPDILLWTLEVLENMLNVGEVQRVVAEDDNYYVELIFDSDMIEERFYALRKHNDDDIFLKAITIYETYVEVNDSEEAVEGTGDQLSKLQI